MIAELLLDLLLPCLLRGNVRACVLEATEPARAGVAEACAGWLVVAGVGAACAAQRAGIRGAAQRARTAAAASRGARVWLVGVVVVATVAAPCAGERRAAAAGTEAEADCACGMGAGHEGQAVVARVVRNAGIRVGVRVRVRVRVGV